MLTIRLQRIGKRHNAEYRLVVAEKSRSVSKKVLLNAGNYNPSTKILTLSKQAELQKYIDLNVELSDTVRSILKKNGITRAVVEKAPKAKSSTTDKPEKAVVKAKKAPAPKKA